MMQLAKVSFMSSLLFVIVFIYYSSKEMKNIHQQLQSNRIFAIYYMEKITENLERNMTKLTENNNVDNSNLKYILQWTDSAHVPFVYMGVGQTVFIERNCRFTNCFVTSDRNLLGDVSKFDVIVFNGPETVDTPNHKLTPEKRSPHQKYAFASIESAGNYPICTKRLDSFFNWTWTYRLDSETKWGYIIVRDSENQIIGPKIDMHWMKLKDMDPVREELVAQLRNKTKAAAWFVSNCFTRSRRGFLVKELRRELKYFDLNVDIYGRCGKLKCQSDAECFEKIKRDYYFYLAFENTFSRDYATEKLLHGLKYNAIPIVYGGANYTRFMPDGIYLNARELGAIRLARKMKHLIDHTEEYREYFRWTNHYSFYTKTDSAETDDYCGICNLLNNETMVKTTSIYNDFQDWWNDPHEHCNGD